jgi:hydroxypyruvate reductase
VPRDDPAVLAPGIADGTRVARRLVGSLDDALEAIQRAAAARGLTAGRGPGRLDGDAEAAARRICHELAIGSADLSVFGGETTVALPERPGRGGRCQHLAVAAARSIAGHKDYLVLAAGTDGRDGASEDAGAIVDGESIERAADAGVDPAAALAAADSGAFLEATGDLLHTGPTGTNVGDVVLALRQPPADLPPR